MERLKKYTKQLNIMLLSVEDDTDMLELLEDIFKENGFENCKFFTDPREALKIVNDEPSICILDYRLLPDLTGLDVMEKVKEINSDCFFIGFTAMQDREVMRRWVNKGLNRWVDKNTPNHLQELVDFVKEA